MKTTLCIAIVFIGAIGFWYGTKFGLKSCMDCGELQLQVDVLTAYKTSQEWYIANERRKNSAFREIIEMVEAER